MNGIYGTVKPANINIEHDVDIFYSYKPNRGYDNLTTFTKLDASNLIKATVDGTTTIDGLYNLKLPLSIFGDKGVYTIYIKPKEYELNIKAVSELQNYPDIRGVVFDSKDLEDYLTTNNALVGYRIQYGETEELFTRIITSSNRCYEITTTNGTKFSLYSTQGGSSSMIFCTVTPSTANSITPNLLPEIGNVGDRVKIANTKFSPIMFEIEMVEHDAETISYMLEGDQVRNLDTGLFTVYNDNHEIYKQYETYSIKTQLGKPLYDIKINKNNIDTTQNYNNVIGSDE
jgi:hypothetical protein